MNTQPILMHQYPAPSGVNGVKDAGHNHAEAFAIMQYAHTAKSAEQQLNSISIWNSRDGVTPFCVFINGEEYQHVKFQQDRYAPHYRPAVGELIFRDCTEDEARISAQNRLEQFKNTEYYPETEQGVLDAIESLIEDFVGSPVVRKITAIDYTSERL